MVLLIDLIYLVLTASFIVLVVAVWCYWRGRGQSSYCRAGPAAEAGARFPPARRILVQRKVTRCLVCDYDVRASKGVCPECGTVIGMRMPIPPQLPPPHLKCFNCGLKGRWKTTHCPGCGHISVPPRHGRLSG
jgi:hypothetical protein